MPVIIVLICYASARYYCYYKNIETSNYILTFIKVHNKGISKLQALPVRACSQFFKFILFYNYICQLEKYVLKPMQK